MACKGVNSFLEPSGTCPETPAMDMPPPAMTAFPGTTPVELGQISRVLRFGRIIWCLARLPFVGVALEFFGGTGGASLLLAHSLSHVNGDHGALFSFERDYYNGVHIVNLIRRQGLPEAHVMHANGFIPWSDLFPPSSSLRGSIVFVGEPLTPGATAPVPLHSLCTVLPQVDLVMVDSPTTLEDEWIMIEEICRPLLVAIHNTNIQGSWIRRRLLDSIEWFEVLNGSHAVPSEWGIDLHEQSWSVFSNALMYDQW